MAVTTRKAFSNTYRENNVPSSKPPKSLTPQKLDESRENRLCFNFDNKYSKGHKCNENKLFYIDCEEEEPKEEEASKEEATLEEIDEATSKEITPTISCHAFAGISTPQTLKIEGYIKKKVTMLIDFDSTQNFIHCKLAKALNCYVYPTPEFQVMIADGGTINCSGKWHNINLAMDEYVLNSPMIVIPMGGVDVVLGVQCLQS